MTWIRLNRKYIVRLTNRWTSRIFALLGFIAIFAPLSGLLKIRKSVSCRIFASIAILIIPLIGAGLSRTGKSDQEILSYLATFIKMHKDHFHGDVHIVVREKDKKRIAITNL